MRKLFGNALLIISIYPILTVIGFISSLLSKGAVNTLFWFIPPSIIFEQIFEKNYTPPPHQIWRVQDPQVFPDIIESKGLIQ